MRNLVVLFKKSYLFNKRIQSFNINNYNKPLQAENIIRKHQRFIYDEYLYLQKDQDMQNSIIQQEQAIYDQFVSYTKPRFERYYQIASKRTIENYDVPECWGEYMYYSKTLFKDETDRQVLYRSKNNQEIKILDIHEVPWIRQSKRKNAQLCGISFSHDHNIIGFILDTTNSENYSIGFKDISKNIFLRDRLQDSCQVNFSKDGSFVLYTKYDEKKRPYQVYQHIFGKQQDQDTLVYSENDEAFFINLAQSQDGEYFVVSSSDKEISEIWICSRKSLTSQPLNCILNRNEKKQAFCTHAHGQFYFLISEENNKKLVSLKENTIKNIFVPIKESIIQCDFFESHIVLYCQQEGFSSIKTLSIPDYQIHNILLPEDIKNCSIIRPGSFVYIGINGNYQTKTFRFHVDTPLIYNSIYEYNFVNQSLNLIKKFNMNGKLFNTEEFTYKRVDVPTSDGTLVPMTLVFNKNILLNRSNPCLLHGYGAYGINLDAEFNIVYLSALEQGWIIAYAHVRGGSDKGKTWHNQALKEKKITSFTDFIACAEYLIAEKFTSSALLCAYGSSAGGLLVGTCVNMKPFLFKAVVLNVPFLDPLQALLDKDLPLTQSDHVEFGNPIENKEYFDIISSYSPYQNIQDQEYPFVLLQCGIQDFRSPIWMALKYLKRFRDRVKIPQRVEILSEKNIVLSTKDCGHYGEVGTSNQISEKCEMMAILEYIVLDKNKDINIKKTFRI